MSQSYSDIVGFSSGPEILLKRWILKPVNFDRMVSSIEYQDVLSQHTNDKIKTGRTEVFNGVEVGSILGKLKNIETLKDEDLLDIKDLYESVSCLAIRRDMLDWIMSLLDDLLNCGLLSEVAKITTIVGTNTLTSYRPTVVAELLSNFSLGGCGPNIPGSCISVAGLTYNDLSDYSNGTFINTLDKIDPNWDKTTSTLTGNTSTDLSVYTNASDDALTLFSFNERTARPAVVGSRYKGHHVNDLKKIYRPYH